ncbi:response regulator [Ferruginibacter sp.]|uniref:response regulator n=1 Tax=Ferruginibacter sp. TaxID=1940288 RepID=UPI0019B4E68D|nr:response regulator [Ferruginibacter sp.]MBC7628495.1 response regulator [Ferruginibacter sp.]
MNTPESQHLEVLIIDDETDICYLLGSLLRKKQIQSKFVNTLKDAANILELNEPEIIFLDNHLPDGLGVNFISYIKRFHPLSKIVMITAHDNLADKQKAFKEGVDYFIGKPFSKETVNIIMENLIH